MKSLMVIDPGKSTGVVVGRYGDRTPFEPRFLTQVEGGVGGFVEWWTSGGHAWAVGATVVCERFVPLVKQGFSHTSDSVEPLRIEGALIMEGVMPADYSDPRWQRPGSMVLVRGSSTAENKKLSDDLLRRAGLWATGKMINRKDANDVNSAMKHALAYLKKTGHKPTIKAYFTKE